MRFSPFFLIVLGFLFIVSSCVKDKKDKQLSNEVVNVQLYSEPRSLHPIFGNFTSAGQSILAHTTEQLTVFDPETAEPRGWLAEDVPETSEDFKTMTYMLREEAAWPDGELITNKDVLFSLKFTLCPASSHPSFIQVFGTRIAGLEAPDDEPRKVIVHCKQAGIQNPYVMGGVPIIDERFFDPEGVLSNWSLDQLIEQDPALQTDSALARWGRVVIGGDYQIKPEFLKGNSGPYQVVAWEQRNYIKLSRNPSYWAKDLDGMLYAQGPSQIILREIRDPSAIELQVKQGAVDAVTFMPAPVWEKLSKDEGVMRDYNLLSGPRTSGLALFMNCKPESKKHSVAMGDWRVRRAVAHLFSPEAYNQQFYAGQGIPVTTPVPVNSKDYHKGLSLRVKSRDSAAYWLEKAGWKDLDGDLIREKIIDGKQVELQAKLTCITGNSTEELGNEIAAEAKAVGFAMESNPLSRTAVSANFNSRDYDLLFTGVQTSHAPYEFSQQWTTDALKAGSNFTGYTNPKIDSLNEISMGTFDLEERRPLMKQMQEIWYHDQPAVMLINLASFGVVRKNLGMKEFSTVAPYLWMNNLGAKAE